MSETGVGKSLQHTKISVKNLLTSTGLFCESGWVCNVRDCCTSTDGNRCVVNTVSCGLSQWILLPSTETVVESSILLMLPLLQPLLILTFTVYTSCGSVILKQPSTSRFLQKCLVSLKGVLNFLQQNNLEQISKQEANTIKRITRNIITKFQ